MPTGQQDTRIDAKSVSGLHDHQRAQGACTFAAHDVSERSVVQACAPLQFAEAELAHDAQSVNAPGEVFAQEKSGGHDAAAAGIVDERIGGHSAHLRYGHVTTLADHVSSAGQSVISYGLCASCNARCLVMGCAYPLVREGRSAKCRRSVCGSCARPIAGVGDCCAAHALVLQRRGLAGRARA